MQKLFDTNVLLDYPGVVELPDTALSLYVVYELDKLKNSSNRELAKKARVATCRVKSVLEDIRIDETFLPSKTSDEGLIDVALVGKYVLVTNDLNLQIRAQAKGVEWEEYRPIAGDISESYRVKLELTDEELAKFYQTYQVDIEMKENQYLLLYNTKGECVDKYIYRNFGLHRVPYTTIDSSFNGVLKPRNLEQELAFHMLSDPATRIKLLTGVYGSGKSFSMIAEAMRRVQKDDKKLVYVRNNIQVKDTDDIGSLPGDLSQKFLPYVRPLAQHVGGNAFLDRYVHEGIIECLPLAFLRGCQFDHSIIYCTEAQNLSTDHVKLLLGRVGEGSELWLDGDFKSQVDRKVFEENNGLRTLIETLQGNPNFGHVNLIKSERSKVAALADLLDRKG